MPTFPLPDDANFEQLRRQAKDVRDLARQGVAGALDLVAEHHPNGAHTPTLAGAQLVVARHYGFESWARLKRHLETIERYERRPDEVGEPGDVADEFLVLACLRFGGDDGPDRWARAARLLREHPALTSSSIYAAAAAATVPVIETLLAEDPTRAARAGGPYGWEPLLYLAYARHDPTLGEAATLDAARTLLRHGADPNAGFLWHGMIPPFTALTGALGGGGEHPPHPHGFALAGLLLDAGADANDGQVLYNRQFGTDDRHLVLLFEHGLGRGDGGPWPARLGHGADSPAELLRVQLWWAIVHDMRDRVRLLVDHGTDFLTPYRTQGLRPVFLRTSDGRTPAEVAALNGCPELVDLLVARGATRPAVEGVDGLVAALLAEDRPAVERLRAHADAARAERPALIVWAAARRRRHAIPLLLELGFDVNAFGRSDAPIEQAWETALHEAAGAGDVELARLLLDAGADPSIPDTRFHSTPLGWAQHFEQPATIALLEPVTPT
ncbi:MAG TPA: ankyrin repeat domain-containing protein [Acidimicrobiia bacterium]|nr:ankyrin repeat domain-containing protein [Acidimicrobiia bacterium]